MKVLEMGHDGGFDLDEMREVTTTREENTLRKQGNVAFQQKEYHRAIEFYTQAMKINTQNQHLLYSNRSAAYSQLKQYQAALDDANQAIQLAPEWIKAYSRKAIACEGLKQWNDARVAYEKILQLDQSCSNTEAKKAATRIKQINERYPKQDTAVRKGFFSTEHAKRGGIYQEKQEVIQEVIDPLAPGGKRLESDDERRWRYMLDRLKRACQQGLNDNGDNVVLDDGMFAKLLDQQAFQSLIYPGIPSEQLEHAPSNLRALLEDPWYSQELLLLMPKVETKAESVLTNVKKRAASQGEYMDRATEHMLRPQILQEAFGREVVAMVHRINYKKHMLLANDVRTLADPHADQATWDQLPNFFIENVLSADGKDAEHVGRTGVLDGFMGEEWIELLQKDVLRMVKNGLLLPTKDENTLLQGTDSSGHMRYLEHKETQIEYPALSEIIEKLHALPYELNAKKPDHVSLCAQFAHCTALYQLKKGEKQKLRLDCGVGERDNGFKLTCIYFLSHSTNCELRLRTQLEMDAPVQVVQPQTDRLIMFQSQRVLNEIVNVEEDLFYIVFWIHGKVLRSI